MAAKAGGIAKASPVRSASRDTPNMDVEMTESEKAITLKYARLMQGKPMVQPTAKSQEGALQTTTNNEENETNNSVSLAVCPPLSNE